MLRKLLVLMAIAALAAMVGACGSSGDGGSSGQKREAAEKPTPAEMVQVAYRETSAEETARLSFDMKMTGIPVGSAASGGADAQDTMMMRMTAGGLQNFRSGEAQINMSMGGMASFEVRQVGKVVYTKMPPEFVAQMPNMKPWMKMDLDATYEQQYGASPGQMQGGAASDPTRQLEYLRGVSNSVEKVGNDTVRGARTTHYKATIDLEKAVAGQGAEAQKAYDELVEQLGTSEIPVEVWLDDQNRVRRYAMDMSIPIPEEAASQGVPEGAEMRMDLIVEYYDFGVPVNVQAPPSSETMDASQMMSAQPAA